MGVGIQQYRSAIGTNECSSCKTFSVHNSKNSNTNYVCPKHKVSLIVFSKVNIIFFATFFLLIQYNIAQINDKAHSNNNITNQVQEKGYRLMSQSHISCQSKIKTYSFWQSNKSRNKNIKSVNGNRYSRGKGIKLLAWNKGNSLLQNKHNDIQTLIRTHKPHILGLSEANLKKGIDMRLVQHDDYVLHTAPTIDNSILNISRVVVYTHNSIVCRRRHDLEDPSLSVIWLEVGLPRMKKFLVANIYREWQYMGKKDRQSGSVQSQLQRWIMFIDVLEETTY